MKYITSARVRNCARFTRLIIFSRINLPLHRLVMLVKRRWLYQNLMRRDKRILSNNLLFSLMVILIEHEIIYSYSFVENNQTWDLG